MCYFVKHRVLKERVEVEHRNLIGIQQLCRNRHQNLVELGLHDVLELQPTRALFELHLFVVGQVDRNGFCTGVCLSRVEHRFVRVEIGIGSWRFFLVFGRNRQSLLQRGQHRGVFGQPFTPRFVLDQHVCFVRGLVTVQAVFVGLDRPDYDIKRVVLHIHPRKIAGLILIIQQRTRAQFEVFPEPCVFGQCRRFAQFAGCYFILRFKRHVIRHCQQRVARSLSH